MSDLVAFLNARLDEDEIAWSMNHGPLRPRIDREVEAKRRILAEYEASVRAVGPGLSSTLGRVVAALAAVYSEHPDYDPLWG